MAFCKWPSPRVMCDVCFFPFFSLSHVLLSAILSLCLQHRALSLQRNFFHLCIICCRVGSNALSVLSFWVTAMNGNILNHLLLFHIDLHLNLWLLKLNLKYADFASAFSGDATFLFLFIHKYDFIMVHKIKFHELLLKPFDLIRKKRHQMISTS